MKHKEFKERLEEILIHFAENFAQQSSDDGSWWGHDTNLGLQEDAFNIATKQLLALLQQEKKAEEAATINWVLNQLSFDGSEQDVKYLEDRLNELSSPPKSPKHQRL